MLWLGLSQRFYVGLVILLYFIVLHFIAGLVSFAVSRPCLTLSSSLLLFAYYNNMLSIHDICRICSDYHFGGTFRCYLFLIWKNNHFPFFILNIFLCLCGAILGYLRAGSELAVDGDRHVAMSSMTTATICILDTNVRVTSTKLLRSTNLCCNTRITKDNKRTSHAKHLHYKFI